MAKQILEHLRDLSEKHRSRVETARQKAENIRKTIDAARRAASEVESEKG